LASFTSPSEGPLRRRWPAWLIVVAAIVVIETGIRRETGHMGPVESYIRAAIHLSRERTRAKFAASVESQPVTTAAPSGPNNMMVIAASIFRPVPPEQDMDKLIDPEYFGNPFVEKLPGLFIPHPFLGYVGVIGQFPFKLDYFGMRNDEDMYFGKYDPDKRCQVLFTWSGNSEAAGLAHKRTVGQYIEQFLNERDPAHSYKVLDLAVNGYALNDEIMAYVALAYALKPEFAITHSGITDIAYGAAIPGGFKELGLIYTFDAYYRWVDRLYDVRLVDNLHPNARKLQPSHIEDLIPGILKTYDRFREIVAGEGGELIIGLPPYGIPTGENLSALWVHWIPEKLKELRAAMIYKMTPSGFIDFSQRTDIKFLDTIHTTDATAQMYADVYANYILERMKTRKLNPARKGSGVPNAC
jgi:hypothetical protein